jgi:hypothetical protein
LRGVTFLGVVVLFVLFQHPRATGAHVSVGNGRETLEVVSLAVAKGPSTFQAKPQL